MPVLYCFYLNSYRTAAFLEALTSSAEAVTVFDFSPLRAVYRGQRVDLTAYKRKQIQLHGHRQAALKYTVVPAVSGLTGPLQPLNLALSGLLALIYSCLAAATLFRKKFKQTIFYNGHLLFTPIFCAARLRKSTITTDLGDLLYLVDNPNRWTRKLETTFLRSSRTIICVSKPFKNHLIEQLSIEPQKISILSAAIPESFTRHFSDSANRTRRAELASQIGADPKDLILVYSGGIWKKNIPGVGVRDVQGVESLCEAFEILNREGRNTWLVLLGDSKTADELERFRRGPFRERFVELGTYAPEGELHCRALGGADYLCLPSYPCQTYRLYDRFKTIEYLAAGKPILAADTAINRHLLGDSGIYYQEGIPASMAQALQAGKAPKAFISDSNDRVRTKYNWKARNDQGLIQKILFKGETLECY